jgi:hypothetical protein
MARVGAGGAGPLPPRSGAPEAAERPTSGSWCRAPPRGGTGAPEAAERPTSGSWCRAPPRGGTGAPEALGLGAGRGGTGLGAHAEPGAPGRAPLPWPTGVGHGDSASGGQERSGRRREPAATMDGSRREMAAGGDAAMDGGRRPARVAPRQSGTG